MCSVCVAIMPTKKSCASTNEKFIFYSEMPDGIYISNSNNKSIIFVTSISIIIIISINMWCIFWRLAIFLRFSLRLSCHVISFVCLCLFESVGLEFRKTDYSFILLLQFPSSMTNDTSSIHRLLYRSIAYSIKIGLM